MRTTNAPMIRTTKSSATHQLSDERATFDPCQKYPLRVYRLSSPRKGAVKSEWTDTRVCRPN
jgi:hypothetical protein